MMAPDSIQELIAAMIDDSPRAVESKVSSADRITIYTFRYLGEDLSLKVSHYYAAGRDAYIREELRRMLLPVKKRAVEGFSLLEVTP